MSVAVAVPSAALIAAADGLQPRSPLLAIEPVAVTTGAVVSTFQLIVRVTDELLPQSSVDEKVRVCERKQPLDDTAPSAEETVTTPQSSLAVAVPRAASIAAAVGLQPRLPLLAIEPVAVITGAF